MNRVHTLFAGLRAQGDALLATRDGPHAELLAMVWDSRFDREHARALLAARPQALPRVLAAADAYDGLPPPRQRRLRAAIVAHRSRWDNPLHDPHPAD